MSNYNWNESNYDPKTKDNIFNNDTTFSQKRFGELVTRVNNLEANNTTQASDLVVSGIDYAWDSQSEVVAAGTTANDNTFITLTNDTKNVNRVQVTGEKGIVVSSDNYDELNDRYFNKVIVSTDTNSNGDIDAIFEFPADTKFIDKIIETDNEYPNYIKAGLYGEFYEGSANYDEYGKRLEIANINIRSNTDYEKVFTISKWVGSYETDVLGLVFAVGTSSYRDGDPAYCCVVGSSCTGCENSQFETSTVILDSSGDEIDNNIIKVNATLLANVGDSLTFYPNYTANYISKDTLFKYNEELPNYELANYYDDIPYYVVHNSNENTNTKEVFKLTLTRVAENKLSMVFRWVYIENSSLMQ